MALTPAEQKKIKKIKKALATNQKKLAAMRVKGADNFAKIAVKYNLWQLDEETVKFELKALAEKYKTT